MSDQVTQFIRRLRSSVERKSGAQLSTEDCAAIASALEHSISPPVDWARPVRMVGTGHLLDVIPPPRDDADTYPIRVCLAGSPSLACTVSRNGIHADTWPRPLVENVPEVGGPTSGEVERFTVVTRGQRHGRVEYVASAEPLFTMLAEARAEAGQMAGDTRIARVLIEDPAQ